MSQLCAGGFFGPKQRVLNDQTADSLSKYGDIHETCIGADGNETRITRTVEETIRATQMLGNSICG